ncbi:MAG TPA: hypothetical protein VGL81_07240 [Polyangiaceae bacterium]
MFIIDWEAKATRGEEPKIARSTRIVETTFGHLRYQLFCSIARFFIAFQGGSYEDILTLQPLTPETPAYT